MIIALGSRYAGAFSNNDNLITDLRKAGMKNLIFEENELPYNTEVLIKVYDSSKTKIR